MKLTPVEKVILENQKIILHGLRALLWSRHLNGPAQEVQHAMSYTHDVLRDAQTEG